MSLESLFKYVRTLSDEELENLKRFHLRIAKKNLGIAQKELEIASIYDREIQVRSRRERIHIVHPDEPRPELNPFGTYR